ncbi:MAG: DNA-3-methyladenine glycosylase [Capsulimonadales bacterium]|nr:DNA-3-methyladenine glycosylase [Capsulimonadales bacterium]
MTRLRQNRFGDRAGFNKEQGKESKEDVVRPDREIGAGPGRLGQAFAITRDLDGVDLTRADSAILIAEGDDVNDDDVITTTRIGITRGVELPWRFYVQSSRCVSKR